MSRALSRSRSQLIAFECAGLGKQEVSEISKEYVRNQTPTPKQSVQMLWALEVPILIGNFEAGIMMP